MTRTKSTDSIIRVEADEPADGASGLIPNDEPEVLARENERLLAEVDRLTGLLDMRNAEYSMLLEQQAAGVRRVDAAAYGRTAVPQAISFNAAQERSRRRSLALMQKARLVELALRVDGRTRTELNRLGHPELITVVAEGEAKVRESKRAEAQNR